MVLFAIYLLVPPPSGLLSGLWIVLSLLTAHHVLSLRGFALLVYDDGLEVVRGGKHAPIWLEAASLSVVSSGLYRVVLAADGHPPRRLPRIWQRTDGPATNDGALLAKDGELIGRPNRVTIRAHVDCVVLEEFLNLERVRVMKGFDRYERHQLRIIWKSLKGG